VRERILILDFGAQYTQLIARRVRECNVYCEIHPFDISAEFVREFAPRGIILSGGPSSVTEDATPRAPQAVFECAVPVLGICYGMQTMAAQLGGAVENSRVREFGYAELRAHGHSALLRDIQDLFDVCLGKTMQGANIEVQPPGTHVDLLQGFLTADIQHFPACREVRQGLQQQGGLADAGIAADQRHLPGDQAAAEHAIELRQPGGDALDFARLDLGEPCAHSGEQLPTRTRALEQSVLQVGVAAHGPDLAEHLVEHARRAPGAPLGAQLRKQPPALGAQQPQHDLAVRERRVVVRDLAQARLHLRPLPPRRTRRDSWRSSSRRASAG